MIKHLYSLRYNSYDLTNQSLNRFSLTHFKSTLNGLWMIKKWGYVWIVFRNFWKSWWHHRNSHGNEIHNSKVFFPSDDKSKSYHKFEKYCLIQMKLKTQKRRSGKQGKILLFLIWMTACRKRFVKFELWLDVEAWKDSFRRRFRFNLFPTTLLNAKRCSFISLLPFIFRGAHDWVSFCS